MPSLGYDHRHPHAAISLLQDIHMQAGAPGKACEPLNHRPTLRAKQELNRSLPHRNIYRNHHAHYDKPPAPLASSRVRRAQYTGCFAECRGLQDIARRKCANNGVKASIGERHGLDNPAHPRDVERSSSQLARRNAMHGRRRVKPHRLKAAHCHLGQQFSRPKANLQYPLSGYLVES